MRARARSAHNPARPGSGSGTPTPPGRALSPSTQVVSLQISGNDIGFTNILEACASATPFGHPCQDKYVVGGDDQISDRIQAEAPKVAAVLQGIRARTSASTKVLLADYAAILPETGLGCWPLDPFTWADVPTCARRRGS